MINENLLSKFKQIKLIIFDVDGVLTDGKIVLGEDGNEYKSFHVHDGLGMVMLMQCDIEVAIITARSSQIVASRMKSLGIKHLYQGQHNKELAYLDIKQKTNLQDTNIAYLGDDIIDLPAMKHSGLKLAVNNAHPSLKKICDYVTKKEGGNGAAREICELLLNAQNKLDALIQEKLS